MAEEFQESDVIFSVEYDSSSSGSNVYNFNSLGQSKVRARKQRKKQNNVSVSVPIRIPSNMSNCSSTDSEEDEEDQVLPPHLIVARRFEERMAFSVRAGYGRPALKGRELSEVRNSILRMTGFLET
ncbi:unnamed protein product [Rhodiola kirilowii]